MFNNKLKTQFLLLKHSCRSWQRLQLVQGRSKRWQYRAQKLAQTTAALLLAANLTLMSAPAQAAGSIFIEQVGATSPMGGVDVGYNSAFTFGDVDGDGDLDVFIGQRDGTINYYQNTLALPPIGPLIPPSPSFSEQIGAANPFNGMDVGSYSTPTFGDVDGDGDLDAFIGEEDGTINYYQNTGTALAPVFTEQTGANNPMGGVDVGYNSTPTFGDVDGDGDLDAFIGKRDGTINYYQNTGTPLNPAFSEQTGAANPLNGVDVGYNSAPTFGDVDGDGDLDAFIGKRDGTINYYENTGTPQSPAFSEQTGGANPFNGVDVGSNGMPVVGDVDGDGDLDAFIGKDDGTINSYLNTGTLTQTPAFAERTSGTNPFNGVDVGDGSVPRFVDIDADGDLDAFIGESNGTIKYYQNTGTPLAPTFSEQTGGNNPFNGVDVGSISTPSFADIDADGDLDVFIGESKGTIKYYQNTGTPLAPTFVEQTGGNNPLDGVLELNNNPSFADTDADGDLDAYIGESLGTIKFYQNTGTPLAPIFVEQTGGNNPFYGVSVPSHSTASFADLDGDGDLDAFIGESKGTIKYYQNTGISLYPLFIEQSGGNNPFDGVDVGYHSVPSFADIDGDGDFDLFIGERDGTVKYYENSHCSFASETDSTLAAGDVLQFGNGDSKVVIKINNLGTPALTSLGITCNASNHPNAAGAQGTGVYWTLTPNAGAGGTTAFDLDITLPRKNPDANDALCRYTGTPNSWDCQVNSNTATDITRTGVTQLSDWAVGDPDLSPLMVELASFTAEAEREQVGIQWQTVSELDNLGFNLYRATDINGEQIRLNPSLIPAQAPSSGQGGTYEFVDEQVEAGQSYVYWLEDVDINGQTGLHGPISATATVPTAVTLEGFSIDVPTISVWMLISFMLMLLLGGWLGRHSLQSYNQIAKWPKR